jgi:hypothetical protein
MTDVHKHAACHIMPLTHVCMCVQALKDRVQERHQAAQASWQDTMAAANQRRAARAAAKAAERSRKKQSLSLMAAANSHAAKVAAAAMGGGALPAEAGEAGVCGWIGRLADDGLC